MALRREIDFRWPVAKAGYEIVDPPGDGFPPDYGVAPAEGHEGKIVRPKRGDVEVLEICQDYPGMFRALAETPKTHEGVLNFANRFGLLRCNILYDIDPDLDAAPRTVLRDYEFGDRVFDTLSLWYNAIDQIKTLKTLTNDPRATFQRREKPIYMTEATIHLGAPSHWNGGPPTLLFGVSSLWGAAALQMSLHALSPTEMYQCHICSNWFPRGPGTNKRGHAVYCSPTCSRRAKYLERRSRETAPEGKG